MAYKLEDDPLASILLDVSQLMVQRNKANAPTLVKLANLEARQYITTTNVGKALIRCERGSNFDEIKRHHKRNINNFQKVRRGTKNQNTL